MSKYTIIALASLCIVYGSIVAQSVFLSQRDNDATNIAQKKAFVRLTTLGDTAISSEASFLRHPSLATRFEIYRDDPRLGSYFVSLFAFSGIVRFKGNR